MVSPLIFLFDLRNLPAIRAEKDPLYKLICRQASGPFQPEGKSLKSSQNSEIQSEISLNLTILALFRSNQHISGYFSLT